MPRLSDAECAELLSLAAPRLGLSAPGFRRVRSQVRKRIARRMGELGIAGLAGYRRRLEEDPSEWSVLDTLCRVTITRFFRDGAVFDRLLSVWLPERARAVLAGDGARFRVFSCGCASGEEPYTLAIGWHHRVAPLVPGLALEIVAQDADPVLLARARAARYPRGAFHELPRDLYSSLTVEGGEVTIPRALCEPVTFVEGDVRMTLPPGPFDLILCRNLAFTYFAPALKEDFLARLAARASPSALLVIGKKESLPRTPLWSPLDAALNVYINTGAPARESP